MTLNVMGWNVVKFVHQLLCKTVMLIVKLSVLLIDVTILSIFWSIHIASLCPLMFRSTLHYNLQVASY